MRASRAREIVVSRRTPEHRFPRVDRAGCRFFLLRASPTLQIVPSSSIARHTTIRARGEPLRGAVASAITAGDRALAAIDSLRSFTISCIGLPKFMIRRVSKHATYLQPYYDAAHDTRWILLAALASPNAGGAFDAICGLGDVKAHHALTSERASGSFRLSARPQASAGRLYRPSEAIPELLAAARGRKRAARRSSTPILSRIRKACLSAQGIVVIPAR